jgi:hypothetical protein
MAALLLATVLVGFAPSFFLRAYFGTPPLPMYLQLHGVVLTAWFLLFFVQTSLIASHKPSSPIGHRRRSARGSRCDFKFRHDYSIDSPAYIDRSSAPGNLISRL